MTNLLALPSETVLAGDYKIRRVLGAGGFGITYLAEEISLNRRVTIKEYFPADFAARVDDVEAVPRSQNSSADYKWGLDRFIEEAQTLAKFEHPNIVRVFRYFRANKTGYMVLQFEEGKSLRNWLKELGRAPRQAELDTFLAPLIDALEFIHARDYLHRDIAPDNIIIRADKSPVLIDFGSARGDIVSQSRTVSALVKPGYSPYEQYSTTTSQQGPWTDIYALGATLYQAVTGKRPPDAPTRVVKDDYIPARDAAIGSFRPAFLAAIDKALRIDPKDRPQSIAEWRAPLLAPPEKPVPAKQRLALGLGLRKSPAPPPDIEIAAAAASPPPPDAPQPQGQFLDYVESLKKPATAKGATKAAPTPAAPAGLQARLADVKPAATTVPPGSRHGLGYGATPATAKAGAPTPAVVSGANLPAPSKPKAVEAVPVPLKKARGSLASRLLFFLRPPWRGLLFKLGVGVGVASLAVAYQQSHAPAPSAPPTRSATVKPSSANATALPQPPPATGDSKALLQLAQHKGPVLALAQQGKRLITVGSDGAVKFSDADTGVLQRAYSITASSFPLSSVASVTGVLAPAPLISVALGNKELVATQADGTVSIWDLDKGERIASTKRLDGGVTQVGLASEGDRFAAAGPDGKVMLLDRKADKPPTLSGESHKSAVRALGYVPDRNGILSTSDDRTVKFWDIEGLTLKRTYRGHNGPVTALDVASDNRSFASGAEDGQIRLWSAASTRLIRTIRAHQSRVAALAFAGDGDLLASAAVDGTLKVFDVKKGKDVLTIAGVGIVRRLSFSSDGRRIIAAGEDGTVRAWDASRAVKSD